MSDDFSRWQDQADREHKRLDSHDYMKVGKRYLLEIRVLRRNWFK